MRKMYSTIDLFAGAGGMSLGFRQTGLFDIKVAYENNPNMQMTYRRNHSDVDLRGDVCTAKYSEIVKQYGAIDIVIGGPPCQGFSNANRQKNHVISENNALIKQYIRAITDLRPRAFVMENVSMLRSDVHRFFLDKKDKPIIKKYGINYDITDICLIEKDYVFDGAIDIVSNLSEIKRLIWPEDYYYEVNIIYKMSKNKKKITSILEKHKRKLCKIADDYQNSKDDHEIVIASKKTFNAIKRYYEGKIDESRLHTCIEQSIIYQRMLSKAKEIIEKDIVVDAYEENDDGIVASVKSYPVLDYLKKILGSDEYGYRIIEDVISAADYGAPQTRQRAVIIGARGALKKELKFPKPPFSGKKHRTVREAIGDLENIEPFDDINDDDGIRLSGRRVREDSLLKLLRDSEELRNHVVTKTTDVAMRRFKALKPGENFHALEEDLKSNTYTDISRTQNTIYLRLNYNEPSGTVVNVRKSMWIHPIRDRAISIREAARLQTFPDSFVFCGTKDQQYQQVGNAVPPIVAHEIAMLIADILG